MTLWSCALNAFSLAFKDSANQSKKSYANLRAALGNDADKDAMNLEILPATGLTNGDYQLLHCRFSVPASGKYVLGIRGEVTRDPMYVSIDDIHIQKRMPHTIRTANPELGTLTLSKAEAYVGDTVAVEYAMNDGCYFRAFTATPSVKWIDAKRFIMLGEDVTIGIDAVLPHAIPFFEGFEEGNTQDEPIAGWVIQSTSGSDCWKANTKYTDCNRTPYAGNWNGTLRYNNDCWMFNAIALEAGKDYILSFRARQDKTTGAGVSASLGSACHKDSMKIQLMKNQSLVNGDYQPVVVRFSVKTSGNYVLGILGIANYTPTYMSIDNIRVEECTTQYTLTPAANEGGLLTLSAGTAYPCDTIIVRRTMNDGYAFCRYNTNIPVHWLTDSTFVMPDENITVEMTTLPAKPVPFFDGFEEGNTDQGTVTGWLQYSEKGSGVWKANSTKTDRNRTPYEGQWNVTLGYGNTNWLMQGFAFEKRKAYRVSLYARQDYQYKSYATVSICLGSELDKDSMTVRLLPPTGITNGDYQLLETTFTVPATASYALGIRGYISHSPYYLSMDNITIEEIPVEEVTPHVSATSLNLPGADETAVRNALSALTLTAVDARDSVVYTYTNSPDKWVIDMLLRDAAYTLNAAELPVGYIFANDTETVHVALENVGTGVHNATANTLQVYPNPATDHIRVVGAGDHIAIYDLAGHVVLALPAADHTAIDITMLLAGVYMLRSADQVAPMIVK